MLSKQNEYGPQLLDEVLGKLDLKNDDLVKHSKLQLTHKQVQKARKGRRVTTNIKNKIVMALNDCVGEGQFNVSKLFNY